MNCGRATFLGARNQIMREIESFFLPQTWIFFSTLGATLGAVSPVQEAEIVLFVISLMILKTFLSLNLVVLRIL